MALPREAKSFAFPVLRFASTLWVHARLLPVLNRVHRQRKQRKPEMSDLVNFIKFNGDKLTGNIASLTYDIDISGEEFISKNEKAPVYQLFATSPRGRRIEVGGIWRKENREGGFYHQLSVNTGHGRLNANLGRYPGQTDENLMAVIPWSE
jgi:uncharacterized protein (DUF736 family)